MSTSNLINLSAPQPYEGQALFVATLARPGENEAAERHELYLSLCSWLIRDRASWDPAWAEQPQLMLPLHACRREADIARDMKTFDRRMRDRATAGHIAIAFLQKAKSGKTPILPKGVSRLNVERMLASVLPDLGMSDTGNVRTRVWTPSLPVIHLCAAWTTIVQDTTRAGLPAPPILEAIQEAGVLALLVERGAEYALLLEKSDLKIPQASLHRFALTKN